MSFLNSIKRCCKRSRPGRRPLPKHSATLAIEMLEDRFMPSASSPAIHAVADNFGNSATFYIDQQDHAFYEHDASHGTRQLSGPNTVQSFSAGVDAQGYADVFVKAGDNSFWEYTNSQGWQDLLGPNTVKSFAAVKDDRLYAQFADNSLHEFDGTRWFWNWTQVPHSGSITALDAVTDTSNRDAIFVENANKTFGEFYNGTYHLLDGTIHGKSVVNTFSAGTDMKGNADVYASMYNGVLDKNVGGAWKYVAAAGVYTQFSATDHEQVWFIGSNNSLDKFDNAGVRHDVYNDVFLSLSAASSNDVDTVVWDHSLWERTGGAVWHEWSGPGTVQQ